jgi:hypothetical protein
MGLVSGSYVVARNITRNRRHFKELFYLQDSLTKSKARNDMTTDGVDFERNLTDKTLRATRNAAYWERDQNLLNAVYVIICTVYNTLRTSNLNVNFILQSADRYVTQQVSLLMF